MADIWNSITGWFSENMTDWTGSKVYLACAIAGGTVILSQLGLNLFGLGGGADVDPDVDVDALEGADDLNFLSIRAISAFLTFFGLVGWAGMNAGWSTPAHVSVAFVSGLSVMIVVALIMRTFIRMQSSGTVDAAGALGLMAQVYLRVPGEMRGKGKITVLIQGRTQEFQAVTAGPDLPTGAACRVTKQITSDTFEVEAVE